MAMAALPLALLVAASGLARVRAQGEIRWAGDLQGGEPYVFRDPRDPSKLVGFEVELVRALASKLGLGERFVQKDRKSTRLNSSHSQISYAVFCLKKHRYVLPGQVEHVIAAA